MTLPRALVPLFVSALVWLSACQKPHDGRSSAGESASVVTTGNASAAAVLKGSLAAAVHDHELSHGEVSRAISALRRLVESRLDAFQGLQLDFDATVELALRGTLSNQQTISVVKEAGVEPRNLLLTVVAVLQGMYVLQLKEQHGFDVDSAYRASWQPIHRGHYEFVLHNRPLVEELIGWLSELTQSGGGRLPTD